MRIEPIQTGFVQIKKHQLHPRFVARPARMLDVLTDCDWSPRLPITCWLVEHPTGLLVVDTGESSHANDPGYQPWRHPYLRTCVRCWVAPDEEVAAQLSRLGFDASDVRWVVMTHMHGDHAGGIGHFPNSEILMTKTEANQALVPTGPLNGYLNMHYPTWLKPRAIPFDAGKWESFDSSALLTPDGAIRMVPTPGHTLGHLSVIVELDGVMMLIGGDSAYSEKALVDGTVDGVAQSYRAHRDSTPRLRRLCQMRGVVTQFAHDPDNRNRLTDRMVTVVSADR